MQRIDLNADIGEGMPYDEQLLKYVSSCNIACGGHFGDEDSISKTIILAKTHHVNIGAHPSYPDQLNFGRRSMQMSLENLIENIDSQLKLFGKCIDFLNAEWMHIKFHGALYNDLKSDTKKAKAITEYLKSNYPDKILFIPPNSEIERIAFKELKTKIEGFADRAYNEDLSLVSREFPQAVLKDKHQVIDQVKSMLINQKVKTIEGDYQPISIESICIHGDTPQALCLVENIVNALKANEISIQ